MAQRMVDEKARAEEPPPGPEETGRPSDPAALAAPADPLAPTDDVSDGETLGSQDTYSQEEDSEEDYTEEEEEEDEQEQGGEEEPTDPLLQHRHPSQSPLARPPIKRREPPAPRRPPSSPAEPPRERATKKRRGNYRSWARHRIEAVARHHPESSFAIRNRTRQSITRQVHYVNDERRLTKMKEDAGKLLSLWLNLEA
ncbi:33 kDa protein [Turkey adenovirus 1]|uniref:33 kDa protein n=1 Tax=Turkey adenovirus 1 TaxID=878329 RepID=E0YC72_9ADEN|nr:33 kDa protein [Turkey adenovirus 1]ADM53805.1 33 kDa protein [Turkey adenovirus 1]